MVDVNTQNKTISVNVSSSGVSSNVNASGDTTMYYSNKAREWAISNRIVDGVDYSSKYYAGRANQSALNAQSFAQSAQDSYNNFQQSVDGALSNIDSSVQGAIDEINNTKTDIITDIEFVAEGEKQEIEELAENAKDDIKSTGFYMEDDKLYFINSKGEVEEFKSGGGGLEIGDIGFTQMAIDETKGKRRKLNGQLIIQEQYVQFTNIIKNSVALNPDLACTESEWQTAVTMSAYGLCEKFVIDDEAGTIRLPKYPNYFIGGVDVPTGNIPVAGNATAIGFKQIKDGTTMYGAMCTNSGQAMFYAGCYGQPVGTWRNGSHFDGGTGIGLTTDTTKSGIEAKLSNDQTEQIKGTYFIQVATGAETKDNIINEIELNIPYSFGDSKYFGLFELNNLSWLKSEGQWNSKAVYPSYYDWALINANNGAEGFKFITDTYTDYDVVINSSNETFRLPLLNGSEDKPNYDKPISITNSGFTADKRGLVVAYASVTSTWAYFAIAVNGVEMTSVGTGNFTQGSGRLQTSVEKGDVVTFVGSYTSLEAQFYPNQGNGSLYFYVGETVQNANLINAGRIEEKLVDKVDINSKVIDGQWVCEQASLSTSTAVGTYTVDLSDYLPKDGYNYEVLFNIRVERTTTSGYSNIYTTTDLLDSSVANGNAVAIVGVDGRYMANTFVKPVGTKRYCQMIISSTAVTAMNFVALAYRRIGTNV